MLKFAFSPCPNDTFAFEALVHKRIACPVSIEPIFHDIDTLNQHALAGSYPISKVSAYCLGLITEEYVMLPTGAAVSAHSGPKLVSKDKNCKIQEATIAIPGTYTTAALLLELLVEKPKKIISLPYHEIVPALLAGVCSAGLIIHETRFTYHEYGLHEIADLGTLFQERYHCPIPLGVIVAKRALPASLRGDLTTAIQKSVSFAKAHPHISQSFVLAKAQEKDASIIQKHINYFVTDDTENVSHSAISALTILFEAACKKNLLPKSSLNFLI